MSDIPHAGHLAAIRAQAKAECDDRRKRLLAWPNLAAKLTDWPWRYERPEQWNGYIPPAHTGTGAVNDSIYRVDLIKLWTEVLDAEAKGTPPGTEEPPDGEVEGSPAHAAAPPGEVSLDPSTGRAPPAQKPYVPAGLRYRDIDDVPLPEEPPPEDEETDW